MTSPNHSENTNFTFIQFDGPNDPLKELKQSHVRAHVTKRFHRDKRATNARLFGVTLYSAPTNCETSRSYLLEYQVDSFGISHHNEIHQLCDVITRSGVFDAVPRDPTLPHHSHPLITQHVNFIEMSCSRLGLEIQQSPLTTQWLPASMAFPALFYASIFVCSASFETLSHQPLSTSSYTNRGRAIRAINAGLSDPAIQKSDEIAAAVLSLANFEVCSPTARSISTITDLGQCVSGDTAALAHHIAGLLELARLRGGIEHLGMKGLLAKLIYLYSWFLELLCDQPLSYLPTYRATCSELPTFYQLFSLAQDCENTKVLCQPYIDSLGGIYEQLVDNSQRIGAHYSSIPEWPGPEVYSQTFHYICLSCITANEVWTNLGKNTLKDLPILRYTLKDYLEKTDISGLWLPIPGALLWCLLVGTSDSYGDPILRPWFVSQLLRFWTTLGLARWEELQRALVWFVYLLKR